MEERRKVRGQGDQREYTAKWQVYIRMRSWGKESLVPSPILLSTSLMKPCYGASSYLSSMQITMVQQGQYPYRKSTRILAL